MATEHSVTGWITAMKGGDEAAIYAVVQRYSEKLIQYAEGVYRRRFPDVSRAAEGPEDAAAAALLSFWRRATNQGFPALTDRNDLWSLLVTITIRKVYRQRKRAMSRKRGGGNVQDWAPEDLDSVVDNFPAPDAAAEFEDTRRAAMSLLNSELVPVAQMWLDGKTALETANELGISERHIYRRRKAIREIWDGHFGEAD